jgi:hypothetical protein
MTDLVMDRRITWDRARLKEIDEAKTMILKYRRMGYSVLKEDGTEMERFDPSLEEVLIKAQRIMGKKTLKILNEHGDERLVWDMNNGKEAKEAKKKFLDYINKGYKAYSVDAEGGKNRRIEEFDVDAEEILMVPPTVKG